MDSLVAHFKAAEPHYVFPTGEDCDELRLCMTKVITQIRKDYKCSAHLEFTAQLICGILGLADKSLKLKTQFHRFLFCQNKTDMKSFADCCAMGKAFPAKIDHAIPVAQLPGYQILMDDSIEWLQLATALLDYMCFMSKPVVQASYHITKTAIKKINPASFACMQPKGALHAHVTRKCKVEMILNPPLKSSFCSSVPYRKGFFLFFAHRSLKILTKRTLDPYQKS